MAVNSLEMRKLMEKLEQLVEVPFTTVPMGYVDTLQPHKDKNHPSEPFVKNKRRKSHIVPRSPNAQKTLELQDRLNDALEVARAIKTISEVPIEERLEVVKILRAIQASFS